MSKELEWIGLKELQMAINRNPQKVLDEARLFLTRGLALYKQGIIRDPWRVNSGGGGAPVSNDTRYPRRYQKTRSGNLRDSHTTNINSLVGTIGPDMAVAPYAKYVHNGTRRMSKRPWLDYVKKTKEGGIEDLYRKMLINITKDLAK